MKRFRVFDLNTPWFWLTIFFQRRYGKPWLEVLLWKPHTWKKWWVYAWKWEAVPDENGVTLQSRVGVDLLRAGAAARVLESQREKEK